MHELTVKKRVLNKSLHTFGNGCISVICAPNMLKPSPLDFPIQSASASVLNHIMPSTMSLLVQAKNRKTHWLSWFLHKLTLNTLFYLKPTTKIIKLTKNEVFHNPK